MSFCNIFYVQVKFRACKITADMINLMPAQKLPHQRHGDF